MQKRRWIRTAVSLILVRSLVLAAFAQDIPTPPAAENSTVAATSHTSSTRYGKSQGYGGFQHRMEQAVGLTPEQREAVHGLLAQQHEQLRTLREGIEPKYSAVQEQTDSKIRALLNPEQLKKFETFLAQEKKSYASRHHRAS